MGLRSIVGAGLLLVTAMTASACAPVPAGPTAPGPRSRIESLTMAPSSGQLLTSPAGHPYRRLVGTVHGVVEPGENVRGLTAPIRYTSQFEVFVPADRPSSLVLVEVENRGNPIAPGNLDDLPQIPPAGPPLTAQWPGYAGAGTGAGFLLDGRRSWARVQWQTGIAEGIPPDAQAAGLVVVRDFGRLLAGRLGDALVGQLGAGPFRDRFLYGGSQSAWAVTTFVADGFNVDPAEPGQGVFPVAITLNGAGNWSALNVSADVAPQQPYVLPDAAPLGPERVLTRPGSDPFLVDLVAWTDYYRLRAGLTVRDPEPAGMRRYDWPAAHGFRQLFPPGGVDAIVFGAGGAACNGGRPVPLSPLDPRPFGRAVVAAVERELVERPAEREPFRGRYLPQSATFALGPAPVVADGDGRQRFNPLPGVEVPVPVTDREGWPVGGVRFPEVELPLGRPDPPAIPPVGTAGIADICGNFGGYRPFTAAELRSRYGSEEQYLQAYGRSFDALVAQGSLLAGERRRVLDAAAAQYEAAP